MRALILCELFPLVHGTQALQMAKVAAALEQHLAQNGSANDLCIVSGAGRGRQGDAQVWRGQSDGNRICLPYLPEPASSLLASRAVDKLRMAKVKLTRNAPFVRAAHAQVREIIESYAPDVVLTVSTPLLWHRVGLSLKKEFPALPWAAFFADPRPLGMLPPPFRHRSPINCYKAWLCRRVLSRADAVIAPNRYMLEWMEQNLQVSLGGRHYIIPHCGLKAAPAANASQYRGWLLHVGSLLQSQVTPDLLDAIKRTAQRHPHDFRGLMCVGRVADSLPALVKSRKMEPYVKLVGSVPPEQAASIIASADANLVADTPLETGYFLHSKFADYAVNGRPILVVGPERCPMKEYLDAYGGGLAVTHRQDEIERALESLFVRKDVTVTAGAGPTTHDGTRLALQFSPPTIAEQYFRAFHQIARVTPACSNRAA